MIATAFGFFFDAAAAFSRFSPGDKRTVPRPSFPQIGIALFQVVSHFVRFHLFLVGDLAHRAPDFRWRRGSKIDRADMWAGAGRLRLLEEKVVELQLVERASDNTNNGSLRPTSAHHSIPQDRMMCQLRKWLRFLPGSQLGVRKTRVTHAVSDRKDHCRGSHRRCAAYASTVPMVRHIASG
jgi:hypothetical protein